MANDRRNPQATNGGTAPLLAAVVDAFVTSRDFNGALAANLASDLGLSPEAFADQLTALIKEGLVEIVHEEWFPNPHIRPFRAPPPDSQFKAVRQSDLDTYCVYPTSAAMKGRRLPARLRERPYGARLWRGGAELEPVFFEMAVLDRYRADPRYEFQFNDTGGMISVRDEYYLSAEYPERDKILLQTFGVGFDPNGGRVVGVFLRYLEALSSEHQRLWQAFERSDECWIHPDYVTSAMGNFPDHGSIFRALLLEQVAINRMSLAMGRPQLFRVTYENGRPDGYHVFFQPTTRNFQAFVLELDKLLSQNLEVDFFLEEVPLTEVIQRRNGEERLVDRGTITILEDWLRSHFRTGDESAIPSVIDGLREVRRLRQRPAHAVDDDRYDPNYWKQQDEVVQRAYISMRTLRLILANYPRAEGVKLPDWIQAGRIRIR